MSVELFILLYLGIQLIFVPLDLFDMWLDRRQGHDPQPITGETVLFFVAILVGYGVLHYGGHLIFPTTEAVLADVQLWVASALNRPAELQPISGYWLLAFSVPLFYISGFWDYALHRWFSHTRYFWWMHEYHHVPSQVNTAMPGLATRPFTAILSFPPTVATVVSAYALLVVLGLPLWDLAPLKALLIVHALLLAASHSSFLRRFWWLHHGMKWLAFTTPQEHVLHHTTSLRGNFGNFTVLWDRLLGTYLDPELAHHRDYTMGLGYDQDYLGAITVGKVKLPATWRTRFQLHRYCNIRDEKQTQP